jgi:hypothetical protein
MWLYVAAIFIIGYPIYESRASISIIVRSVYKDIMGLVSPPMEMTEPMDKNDMKLQATSHNSRSNSDAPPMDIK